LRYPYPNLSHPEDTAMARRALGWLAFACLSLTLLTSACTRSDATGPSDTPAPSLESQGANN